MRVLVSAGDASGDAHAAELVTALRSLLPALRVEGLGGAALERAGVEILVPQREVAVGGLVEVLGAVPRVLAAWRRLARAARAAPTDLAILVDAPDLNLPLARRLRRVGVPILYYVAPQVWAWRSGRVRKLARRVDCMAVIFPFEAELFAAAGVRAEFVGHPLVDRVAAARARIDRGAARAAIGVDPGRPLVALFPGSRRNEIRSVLPLHLAAARCLRALEPKAAFALALAPSVSRAEIAPILAAAAEPAIAVVEGSAIELMAAADVALAKPGSVTLELALLGCPMVAAARAHPLTAALLRRLVRVPSLVLPNLIAGAPVVPEFLQEQAAPDRIAAALAELLAGPARELQRARLAEVERRLGAGGAAARAAALAEGMIRGALDR
jgi:lipid-A-disaccharide synthase